MRKAILLTFISLVCIAKVNAQTTVHGSSVPVTLYNLTGGYFFKVVTTDIWMYADGSVGVTTPYTLQQVAPPTINGTPVVDFRPMTCYEGRVAWGQTAVKCGPYRETFSGGTKNISCGDTDDTTCKVSWTDEGGIHREIYNVQIP